QPHQLPGLPRGGGDRRGWSGRRCARVPQQAHERDSDRGAPPVIGAEHFAAPPHWEWWILAYFFFGGLAGGSYVLGTLIRFVGTASDQRAARIAYIVSFLALIPCPLFLVADLGQPLRFVN